VSINIDRPIKEVLADLTKYPVKTPLYLTGTMIVARDIAHAELAKILEKDGDLPEYFKKYPVYYAGPAKTPPGKPTGSFGPTTAGRMDSYVALFQEKGASLIMVAKGNRTQEVTDSCKKYGGFYLGSIGGPAALLANQNILSNEVLAFPELGMEAIRKITVKDFPAFIIVDDKGNDFFKELI
jgi:fumarate hydratase class I